MTRQTQHLTRAFELQSQHIRGLLVELQEKEGALLRQGGELQGCKQELAQLTAPTTAQAPTGPGPELHTTASPSEPSPGGTVNHPAGGDKDQASDRRPDSGAPPQTPPGSGGSAAGEPPERGRLGAGPLGGSSSQGRQEATVSRDDAVDGDARKEETQQESLVKVSRLEQQVGLTELFFLLLVIIVRV